MNENTVIRIVAGCCFLAGMGVDPTTARGFMTGLAFLVCMVFGGEE